MVKTSWVYGEAQDLKVLWDVAITNKQICWYLQATMAELLRVSVSADGYAERLWAFLFPAYTCRLRLKHFLWEKEVPTEFSSCR